MLTHPPAQKREGFPIHWSHYAAVFIIFAVVYFGMCLPLVQRLSMRVKGRRFVVRLGTPWKIQNPDHRWDVLMSVLSFMAALALSMWALDLLMQGGYLPSFKKR